MLTFRKLIIFIKQSNKKQMEFNNNIHFSNVTSNIMAASTSFYSEKCWNSNSMFEHKPFGNIHEDNRKSLIQQKEKKKLIS